MDRTLRYATIPELRGLLDRRVLSAEELATETIIGLQTIGHDLHSVATLLPKRARHDAVRADRRRGAIPHSPLAGIPWGAKDLIDVRGAPIAWGVPAYHDRLATSDAAVVRRLSRAGGVLTAKLATIELAGGWGYRYPNASLQGATRTPWNRDHWSGGSSSGSGAAVGAGLLPFAIGSETSGSIASPAAYCGVTGLRPTFGLVSRAGVMPLSWTLDKVGPLARTAIDTWTVLCAIEGADINDPATIAPTFRPGPARRRPRLPELPSADILPTLRYGFAPADFGVVAAPEARNAFAIALSDLQRIGGGWREVTLPTDLPYGAIISLIGGAEGATAHGALIEGPDIETLVDSRQRASLKAGREILAHDYIDAQRARRRVQTVFDQLFAEVDVIVSIALPGGAPRFDEPLDGRSSSVNPVSDAEPNNRALIPASNLAGLPAIFLPCGFTTGGLPVALQVVGPPWSEAMLVAIGAWFQSQTDWHRRTPPHQNET